jgi:hypothetical protein
MSNEDKDKVLESNNYSKGIPNDKLMITHKFLA